MAHTEPGAVSTCDTGAAGWSAAPWRVLIALVALGAGVRLFGLSTFSLWYDEAASLFLGRFALEPAKLFDAAWNTEPPAQAIITGLWHRAILALGVTEPASAGSDFLIRLLPCGFGIVNCVLVFGLTRRLTGCVKTARWATLFFALSPFQFYYAQELRIYSVYTTLALLAAWCIAGLLERPRGRHWAGYIAAMALLHYCHYIAMWFLFASNAVFLTLALAPGRRAPLGRWIAANTVVMLLIAPALYRAFAMHAVVRELALPWYPNPGPGTVLITFKNFFAGYSPTPWAYWPLLVIGLGLWCAGILRRDPGGRNSAALLGGLTAVPVIGCAIHWGLSDFSFYEHRLFILSGVMALIGAAWGAARLGRPGSAAALIVAALMAVCLVDHYRGRIHPEPVHRLGVFDKVDFRSAARTLEEHWRTGDRLVYPGVFCAYPMFHYFPKDQAHIGWDKSRESVFIQVYGHEALLRNHRLLPVPREDAVAGAGRIWLLTSHGNTFDSPEFRDEIRAWLDETADRRERHVFSGLELSLYQPRG